jgi:hypothetical protein
MTAERELVADRRISNRIIGLRNERVDTASPRLYQQCKTRAWIIMLWWKSFHKFKQVTYTGHDLPLALDSILLTSINLLLYRARIFITVVMEAQCACLKSFKSSLCLLNLFLDSSTNSSSHLLLRLPSGLLWVSVTHALYTLVSLWELQPAIFYLNTCKEGFMFMSMGWDYVSELRPLTGPLFTPQMI